MQNIINLTAARDQRRWLSEQATIAGDSFVVGLQQAGQTLANLAWILAAPVRHRDKGLKDGIYELLLGRLDQIITDAIDEIHRVTETKQETLAQARTIASAAFATQLLSLAAAESNAHPSGPSRKIP